MKLNIFNVFICHLYVINEEMTSDSWAIFWLSYLSFNYLVLFLLAWDAITKYCRLGGLYNRNLPYFLDYKMHPPIWEENAGTSYSPNVAYIYIGEILCYLCY